LTICKQAYPWMSPTTVTGEFSLSKLG
jgi:hypothetical protein